MKSKSVSGAMIAALLVVATPVLASEPAASVRAPQAEAAPASVPAASVQLQSVQPRSADAQALSQRHAAATVEDTEAQAGSFGLNILVLAFVLGAVVALSI